jgi:ribosomal protein S12 methylthiotransferase accessory factor
VLELKLLINLALGQLEEAQELVGAFLQYNDNTVDRGLFYQAMNVVLEVALDEDMELATTRSISAACSATPAWTRAGLGRRQRALLRPDETSMKLEGLERHQRLLDSYKNCTPPAPKLSGRANPGSQMAAFFTSFRCFFGTVSLFCLLLYVLYKTC